tara:strand:+ start:115 stop:1194 length:1080 start_codon:yes stop_codon:yes gene_type:complete
MANKALTDELCRQTLEAIEIYGNTSAAAAGLKINRSTFENRVRVAKERFAAAAPKDVELPTFPSDDIPIVEILDTMEKRFSKRAEAQAAKKWFTVKVKNSDPMGLCFIGDPHIDSNGCNISLLRRDIELMNQPGMFCVNLGDTTDGDWPGRLMKLHAQSDQSITTARRLADWFLNDTGLRWLAILIGNHDAWGEGAEILRRMNVQKIPMMDWSAHWKIKFSNERECKIITAHDFPGHSMWNSLHANQRAATTSTDAHIYASGHKHNWAMHQEENAHREFVYWLVRARGYKYIDSYADKLGYASQQHGATICAIIDPKASSEARFVTCFADLEEASDYLKFKRQTSKRASEILKNAKTCK